MQIYISFRLCSIHSESNTVLWSESAFCWENWVMAQFDNFRRYQLIYLLLVRPSLAFRKPLKPLVLVWWSRALCELYNIRQIRKLFSIHDYCDSVCVSLPYGLFTESSGFLGWFFRLQNLIMSLLFLSIYTSLLWISSSSLNGTI